MGKNKQKKMKHLSEIIETCDRLRHAQIGQQEAQEADGLPPYSHIMQNEFFDRMHKKLEEEDIVICECKYDANNPESACGESCLNVLTSTECTPGYCPCGEQCKNQKFQKCENAKTKLIKTEGRGWGLLADEHIKAGRFIIEYCGEVISSEEAQQRSQTYEDQGLIDAYIISLNTNYFIDATRKGSLARFINHSCQPNCETRKWIVLGETRVGIYAKQDISVGTELAYDYKFEWYGGATVRCLCGAAQCSLFLGAKSQGFQEYNHLWEEGDDRYTVENVPLYDSSEEDPFPASSSSYSTIPLSYETTVNHLGGIKLASVTTTESRHANNVQGEETESVETERNNETEFSFNTQAAAFAQTKNPTISHIGSNSACGNYNFGAGASSKKRPANGPKQKAKAHGKKYVSSKPVAQLFASKQAREEISKYEPFTMMDLERFPVVSGLPGPVWAKMNPTHRNFHITNARSGTELPFASYGFFAIPNSCFLCMMNAQELKNKATSKLNAVYDEIRPAIEAHEMDSQDNVPTSVAGNWMDATCDKWKADIDFSFSIIKNVMFPPKSDDSTEATGSK